MSGRWRFWLAALSGLVLAALAPPIGALEPAPLPDATAFLLLNPATGEVLAERDADEPLPMASLTKVMTALVVRDRAEADEVATVPPEAAIGGSTAGLVVGESIRVDDLLRGLLVASGNDAAVTLAHHVAGSEEAFVALMNARAQRMDLQETRFQNPHGLDEAGHQSSARDLVELGRAAMRDPVIRAIVGAGTIAIPGPDGVGVRTLESRNDLLGLEPAVDGIKTGNTSGAGFALLAHARRPELGTRLLLAVVGSPSEAARAADGAALLRWGLDQYARPALLAEGELIGRAPVYDRPGVSVGYAAAGSVRAPIRLEGAPITETVTAPPQVHGPLAAGQVVGGIVLRQGGRVLGRRDLVAVEAVDAPSLIDRVHAGLTRTF